MNKKLSLLLSATSLSFAVLSGQKTLISTDFSPEDGYTQGDLNGNSDWNAFGGNFAVSTSETVTFTPSGPWRRAEYAGSSSGFTGDHYVSVTEFRVTATGSAFLQSGDARVLAVFWIGSDSSIPYSGIGLRQTGAVDGVNSFNFYIKNNDITGDGADNVFSAGFRGSEIGLMNNGNSFGDGVTPQTSHLLRLTQTLRLNADGNVEVTGLLEKLIDSGWVQVANTISTTFRDPGIIADGMETYGFASGTINNSVFGLDVHSVRVLAMPK